MDKVRKKSVRLDLVKKERCLVGAEVGVGKTKAFSDDEIGVVVVKFRMQCNAVEVFNFPKQQRNGQHIVKCVQLSCSRS